MSPAERSSAARLPTGRAFGRKVTFSLGRESVSLPPRVVEQLVGSLRQLHSSTGDAVADEVSSLATAGIRIDLRLSAAELRALAEAITGMQRPSRPLDSSVARLLAQLRELQTA